LEAPAHKAGAKVACPGCGQRLQVSAPPRNRTVLGELLPGPAPSPPKSAAQPRRRALPAPPKAPATAPVRLVEVAPCQGCGTSFKIPEDMVGQWVQCPTCGLLFTAETLPAGLELVPAAEHNLPLRAVPRQPPSYPAHVQPQQIQVNTTVVNEQAPPVSSFAVASMLVSVLAFFFCWVPSVGFFLGGLALLLGCCAHWAVRSRGERGAGFAVAGIGISLVPIGISGYLTLQLLPLKTGAEGRSGSGGTSQRSGAPAPQADPEGEPEPEGQELVVTGPVDSFVAEAESALGAL
jgi:hypothetical protein